MSRRQLLLNPMVITTMILLSLAVSLSGHSQAQAKEATPLNIAGATTSQENPPLLPSPGDEGLELVVPSNFSRGKWPFASTGTHPL